MASPKKGDWSIVILKPLYSEGLWEPVIMMDADGIVSWMEDGGWRMEDGSGLRSLIF